MNEFTIEAVFRVDAGGDIEQKMIHIQSSTDVRLLYELEFTSENEWFLENYIQVGDQPEQKLWLADTFKVHPTNAWYHAAVTYKDGQFIQYINGVVENTGTMDWVAPTDGVSSLGARQNKVGYVTGAIKMLKATDKALSPADFVIDYNLISNPKLLLFESLDTIGGYEVEVFGNPEVIETKLGKAIEFDGIDDGIYINGSPLAGISEFTIESVLKPYSSYPDNTEPRYVHFEDPDDNNRRITMEYRLNSENDWYFDGFLKSPSDNLTLIDESLTHASDEWMHAAITYKSGVFTTYVNGEQELTGNVVFEPLAESAIISAGMRMNQVNYMQGAIHSLKITHSALSPEEFTLASFYDTTNPGTEPEPQPSAITMNLHKNTKLEARVYGNRTDGLHILPLINEAQTVSVKIFTLQGQMVYTADTYADENTPIEIDAFAWNEGLYIIHLSTASQLFSATFPIL